MAFRSHAIAERKFDRRFRSPRARLLGVETAARTGLAQALALRGWGGVWRSRRRDIADLVGSPPRADRGRNPAHGLQSLRVLSSGPEVGHNRRQGRRRDRGIFQRRSRRPHRPCGHTRDDLVWIARLAQGCSARGFPAGRGCDLPDERVLARRQRDRHGRHAQALRDGIALRFRGNLARPQAFRKN